MQHGGRVPRDRIAPRPGGRTGRRMNSSSMADPTGFEPAISSVTGWHVGPLHHGSAASAEDSRPDNACQDPVSAP